MTPAQITAYLAARQSDAPKRFGLCDAPTPFPRVQPVQEVAR